MNEQNENKDMELDPIGQEREENVNAVEDIKESEKEDSAIVQDQSEANDEEEMPVEQEAEESSKDASGLEENASVNEEALECSCSYEPPYGAPISEGSANEKKKKTDKGCKGLIAFLVAIVVVLTFIAGAVAGQWFLGQGSSVPTPSGGNSQGTQIHSSYSEVVESVAASVVEIEGSGSGIIIDQRGYILTNEHVVSDFVANNQSIVVVLADGTRYENATYQGGDSKYDIAVLKIETSEALPSAKKGNSSDLKVGDEVLAIGNPLATLGGTVTTGIISAKDRQVRVDHYLMTLLQTDAAINPGNSGGGLFNMAGELIGVVNAKQFATGIEGLGYAIPIDLAWKYAEDIIEYGYVTGKPYIGISFAEAERGGVYIISSSNELLKQGDQILVIDGTPINKISDMYSVTDHMKIGDKIQMTVKRDGEPKEISIEVIEYKPEK